MKRRFLVVYDYGQGAVWGFVLARSAAQVRERFPELKVVTTPPKWMSKPERARLRTSMTWDLDRADGLLEEILKGRTLPKGSSPRRGRASG